METPDCLVTASDSYQIRTYAPNRDGELPLTPEFLLNSPSGDVFGFSQDVGMGWDPKLVAGPQILMLTTLGGLRQDDGMPLALGYHTGHWELGLLAKEAAKSCKSLGCLPYAAHCSDPCDGRTQGTTGMMDSLAYRNSAAETFGRLIRSLPRAKGLIGIATCDKGLPAMMMALANASDLPGILIPGGTTLPPERGEDAGAVQSIGTRFAHGELSLKEAATLGCVACASSGGGCQFLGTAASAQVVGEALGISLPHSALAPSGEPVWLELGRQSAHALTKLVAENVRMRDIITPGAVANAMAVHAAFGASTNLLLHLPAIAHAAGLERPSVEDWIRVNHSVHRMVDVLPNGPRNFRTVQVFLAGGVPEVMLQLRELGALDLSCRTVAGMALGDVLDWWEQCERRQRFRDILHSVDGVDPDDVIRPHGSPRIADHAPTLVFPQGNLAPDGAVVKSTAIDPSLFVNGIYENKGRARVFTSEDAAIAAVKSQGEDRIHPNDIIVLICRGPLGAGMPETAQITIALKHTKALKNTALITDGRFSGVSSGPCIGHIGPEALAGGPIGKICDGDLIHLRIDSNQECGTLDLLGDRSCSDQDGDVAKGNAILAERTSRGDLAADPALPTAVRLWASLQQRGGGTWGGCVYDVDQIIADLNG